MPTNTRQRTHSSLVRPGVTSPNAIRASHNPSSIRIYDPKELRRAIDELEGCQGQDDFLGPAEETPLAGPEPLSAEDTCRLKALRRIANNRLGPSRHLIHGSSEMLHQLQAVTREAPHFKSVLELVSRAVQVSIVTKTPLRLPPTLLVGRPGIGKTYVLKRIAEAIGSHFELLAANTLDSFRLRGLSTAWKGARAGKVADTILKSPCGSPIIALDEFASLPRLNAADRPFDIFLTLFEEENAGGFLDDYLEISLRADHIFWFASANSIEGLPEPILDRLMILQIPNPKREQLMAIVDGIYAAVCEPYTSFFSPNLQSDVQAALALHNPRRLKRLVRLAIGFAVGDSRRTLSISDVEQAALFDRERSSSGFSYPVGFIASAGNASEKTIS